MYFHDLNYYVPLSLREEVGIFLAGRGPDFKATDIYSYIILEAKIQNQDVSGTALSQEALQRILLSLSQLLVAVNIPALVCGHRPKSLFLFSYHLLLCVPDLCNTLRRVHTIGFTTHPYNLG